MSGEISKRQFASQDVGGEDNDADGDYICWSPAVRTGSSWEHYISIDFLKKTRVTRIQLETVAATRKVTKFKLQYSHSGQSFSNACPLELTVPANDIVDLPSDCRFEARYARMLITEASGAEGSAPIGVRFEWFGCPIETVDATCNPLLSTVMTDTASGWRHVAFDSANGIFYFCDFVPKKRNVGCYSTTDGIVWNAMPSYIGRLVGFDAATAKMYAMDKKERAMVSSIDGVNWAIVDSVTAASVPATATAPSPIPGMVEAQLSPITVGPWTADYTGISIGGTYKAKWSSCCS
ncbi:hypothetical protein SK128_011129 [Halocaridina rubra]|uniref:F5/8 type C domain-containing protein n=1 Tax=Halocaridina rubra TaxID=373956 RepID=A0AAN9ACY9_HALRR